jgi:phosphoribosylamine---glycine ligase
MKVLLIGSGGREHAMAWKLSQSPLCSKLFIAPGNPGTAKYGINLPISADNFEGIARFVIAERPDVIVPGPEVPLVKGLRDFLQKTVATGDALFLGPGENAAALEGSKAFSKSFMQRHKIPTAAYGVFVTGEDKKAIAFLDTMNPPYVIKADGLAAGKGVVITDSFQEAENVISDMLSGRAFGNSGRKLVIEEFLEGTERSLFVFAQGGNYLMLPAAKDYKRAGEGDQGLNTGGMGSVSGPELCSAEFLKRAEENIIVPTLAGMADEGMPYSGFLFLGLMDVGGNPKVIEYNVRMGDPETESVMPRINSDLLACCIALHHGEKLPVKVDFSDDWAVTVMMVSSGYPGSFEKGCPLEIPDDSPGLFYFHAGTSMQDDKIVSTGGRVLAVTALSSALSKAIERAYSGVAAVDFPKSNFRKDIGRDLLQEV